ncbi:hypothetical protein LUW74_06080 [Actinomadura madurae]|nr:hypothetical protein [Actinomadura madurae]URN02954.1 hypothetical protein LUW74_06080 [Actinomadura madurae]
MLASGPPTSGSSPAASGAEIATPIVVSVAPYPLTNRRPAAQRATCSALKASPTDVSVTTDGTSAGSSVASAEGGRVAYETSCRAITSVSPGPGSSSLAGATTSRAPG